MKIDFAEAALCTVMSVPCHLRACTSVGQSLYPCHLMSVHLLLRVQFCLMCVALSTLCLYPCLKYLCLCTVLCNQATAESLCNKFQHVYYMEQELHVVIFYIYMNVY